MTFPIRSARGAAVAGLLASALGLAALAAPAQARPKPLGAIPLDSTLPYATFFSAASATTSFTIYNGAKPGTDVIVKSDGTPAGTSKVTLVPRLYQGQSSSRIEATGDRAFFPASTLAAGEELWTSDGTTAGTTLLRDIAPGAAGSNPRDLTVVGSKAYFMADDGDGKQLWVSDGTSEGTLALTNHPEGCGIDRRRPDELAAGDGVLWFTFRDASCVRQLWKTTGTVAGTQPVTSFTKENEGDLYGIGADGSRAFFTWSRGGLDDSVYDLYVTDSSSLGANNLTHGELRGILTDAYEGYEGGWTVFKHRYYFRADDATHGSELWSSDGTDEGTVLFDDRAAGSAGSYPANLTVVGDRLLYYAGIGRSPTEDTHFSTSGTASDITPLSDEAEEYAGGVVADGKLFYIGYDIARGYELWQTDGTVAGTGLAAEIRPGTEGGGVEALAATGDRIFFVATAPAGSTGNKALYVTGRGEPVTNSVAPTLSGTPRVGATTTVNPGTWGPAGRELTFRWSRSKTGGKTAISGATTARYRATPADIGRTLSVEVTGKFGASRLTRTVTAARTKAGILKVTKKPTASGTAKVGKKLTAKAGSASPKATPSYRWLRNGASIKGATKSTYTLKKSDGAKRISVKVTWKKRGYTSVSSTSARTAKVKS